MNMSVLDGIIGKPKKRPKSSGMDFRFPSIKYPTVARAPKKSGHEFYGMSMSHKKVSRKPMDITIPSLKFGNITTRDMKIPSIKSSDKKISMGNHDIKMGIRKPHDSKIIKDIFGSNVSTSNMLGQRISPKQKRYLMKHKGIERFYDSDGDGVINGLDCDWTNPKKHGYAPKKDIVGRNLMPSESENLAMVSDEVRQLAKSRLNDAEYAWEASRINSMGSIPRGLKTDVIAQSAPKADADRMYEYANKIDPRVTDLETAKSNYQNSEDFRMKLQQMQRAPQDLTSRSYKPNRHINGSDILGMHKSHNPAKDILGISTPTRSRDIYGKRKKPSYDIASHDLNLWQSARNWATGKGFQDDEVIAAKQKAADAERQIQEERKKQKSAEIKMQEMNKAFEDVGKEQIKESKQKQQSMERPLAIYSDITPKNIEPITKYDEKGYMQIDARKTMEGPIEHIPGSEQEWTRKIIEDNERDKAAREDADKVKTARSNIIAMKIVNPPKDNKAFTDKEWAKKYNLNEAGLPKTKEPAAKSENKEFDWGKSGNQDQWVKDQMEKAQKRKDKQEQQRLNQIKEGKGRPANDAEALVMAQARARKSEPIIEEKQEIKQRKGESKREAIWRAQREAMRDKIEKPEIKPEPKPQKKGKEYVKVFGPTYKPTWEEPGKPIEDVLRGQALMSGMSKGDIDRSPLASEWMGESWAKSYLKEQFQQERAKKDISEYKKMSKHYIDTSKEKSKQRIKDIKWDQYQAEKAARLAEEKSTKPIKDIFGKVESAASSAKSYMGPRVEAKIAPKKFLESYGKKIKEYDDKIEAEKRKMKLFDNAISEYEKEISKLQKRAIAHPEEAMNIQRAIIKRQDEIENNVNKKELKKQDIARLDMSKKNVVEARFSVAKPYTESYNLERKKSVIESTIRDADETLKLYNQDFAKLVKKKAELTMIHDEQKRKYMDGKIDYVDDMSYRGEMKKLAEEINKKKKQIEDVKLTKQTERQKIYDPKTGINKQLETLSYDESILKRPVRAIKEGIMDRLSAYAPVKEFEYTPVSTGKKGAGRSAFEETSIVKAERTLSPGALLNKMTGYAFSNPEDRKVIKLQEQKDITRANVITGMRLSKPAMGINKGDIEKIDKMVMADLIKPEDKDKILKRWATELRLDEIEKSEKQAFARWGREKAIARYPIELQQEKMALMDALRKQKASEYSMLKTQYEIDKLKPFLRPEKREGPLEFIPRDLFGQASSRQRLSGLSDFMMVPIREPQPQMQTQYMPSQGEYRPTFNIPEPNTQYYDPNAPRFVYEPNINTFTRKVSRLAPGDEPTIMDLSQPTMTKRPGSQYPWSKPMKGWRRRYVGRGRLRGKGRQKRVKKKYSTGYRENIRPDIKNYPYTPYMRTYKERWQEKIAA